MNTHESKPTTATGADDPGRIDVNIAVGGERTAKASAQERTDQTGRFRERRWYLWIIPVSRAVTLSGQMTRRVRRSSSRHRTTTWSVSIAVVVALVALGAAVALQADRRSGGGPTSEPIA